MTLMKSLAIFKLQFLLVSMSGCEVMIMTTFHIWVITLPTKMLIKQWRYIRWNQTSRNI